MNNSKFDKYLLRSFLKNTGLAIISISAIALVIFACYVVYIGIGKASTYVFNNFVLTLKTIGYIVLFLIALIKLYAPISKFIIKCIEVNCIWMFCQL